MQKAHSLDVGWARLVNLAADTLMSSVDFQDYVSVLSRQMKIFLDVLYAFAWWMSFLMRQLNCRIQGVMKLQENQWCWNARPMRG
jgi:hypothetical protein